MSKKILILTALMAVFFIASSAAAHVPADVYTILEVKEPALLPTSPIYFIKSIGRGIKLFFTFDPIKKAETELKFSDEKLAELTKVASSEGEKAIEKALNNYLDAQKTLQARLETLRGKNKNVDNLLEKLADRTVTHQKLFKELEEIKEEKTKEASEDIAQTVKKALELDKKKFKEKLKEHLKKESSDDLEDLEALEELEDINKDLKEELDDVKDELDEAAREAENKTGDEIAKAVKKLTKLEMEIKNVPPEDKKNIEVLLGEGRTKLEEARAAFREKQFGRAFGLARAAKSLVESAEQKVESLEKELDKLKKEMEDISEEKFPEIDEKNKEPILCTQEYNPVCGEDGKTYSNSCHAKVAGKNIKHSGECEKLKEKSEFTVVIGEVDFNPASLKIKKGDKVVWVNKSEHPAWIASGPHPIHNLYPELNSFKEFNAGENFSFIFERVGTWGYHNHRRENQRGSVEVVE